MNRLFIFDADNTLRRTVPDKNRPPFKSDEWELLPKVSEVMGKFNWSRVKFGIASNQASVGRGLVSHDAAYEMLYELATTVTGLAHAETAIQMCPHLPNSGCRCRKPEAGMLLDIMNFFNVPPVLTVFIGDAQTDNMAAKSAGCRFVHTDEFLKRGGHGLF